MSQTLDTVGPFANLSVGPCHFLRSFFTFFFFVVSFFYDVLLTVSTVSCIFRTPDEGFRPETS